VETFTSCWFFDALYGQALFGLLGVVTREMIYFGAGVTRTSAIKPSEVHRLKIYVELMRFITEATA
jgi:hypothetical protein